MPFEDPTWGVYVSFVLKDLRPNIILFECSWAWKAVCKDLQVQFGGRWIDKTKTNC
jgi:hypothetical protein